MSERNPNAIAIIPARYDSSRFPGKPLAEIQGKPMIRWVAERTAQASLISRVLVATDDDRIFNCVQSFGGEVVMTSEDIPSGSDRIALVAMKLDTNIIVNVQGDEPFVEPSEIDQVIHLLLDDAQAVVGTLVQPISDSGVLNDPNVVKVVLDEQQHALYFSRSPIPFSSRDSNKPDQIQAYRHVGIYSYRKDFLLQFSNWEPTPLEYIEKLEQLRVLEKGYTIKVGVTAFDPLGVDTPEDLEKARRIARERFPKKEVGIVES